jgi:hypothetical protein
MAQQVGRWPLTAEVRVRARVRGTKWHWTGFSPSASVFPVSNILQWPYTLIGLYHVGYEQQGRWWPHLKRQSLTPSIWSHGCQGRFRVTASKARHEVKSVACPNTSEWRYWCRALTSRNNNRQHVWDKIFLKQTGRTKIQCPDQLWGPPSLLFSMYRDKARLKREADHSPPSTEEVKNEYEIFPLPSGACMAVGAF